MRNFRSDRRESFGDRSGGRSRGGRSGRDFGSRGRDRGDRFGRDRRPPQMHDVTCDKCGRECQVPFRPTGDKPVLCSDCFRKNDSAGNFNSRERQSGSSGISSQQFNELNDKLNKILKVLQDLELDIDDDSEEENSDEDDEDIDDDEVLEDEANLEEEEEDEEELENVKKR